MSMNGLDLGRGLNIRPSKPVDQPFLEQLHDTTRSDLKLIDGDRDFVDGIIQLQFRAQSEGYGSQFPNAMYFVVEKQQERIGKVTIDFGPNEVRLIDIAFIPEARGKGYGEEVLRSLQQAATQVGTPLTLTVQASNVGAKSLYTRLGFVVESAMPPYESMVWYPPSQKIIV